MPTLEAGKLYALDGGIFRAHYREAAERFELWTYLGREGYVVARTGFEIDEHGGLYDRIYDIEAARHVVPVFPRFTLADVQEVTPAQAATWDSTLNEEELYRRWPELRGRIDFEEEEP